MSNSLGLDIESLRKIRPDYDVRQVSNLAKVSVDLSMKRSRHYDYGDGALSCSFCHKSQDTVGKLISNPSDYPRAYICDECIAVCNLIIEDDRAEQENAADAAAIEDAVDEAPPHPLLSDPLASELMQTIENWIREESLRKDGVNEISKLREIAKAMLARNKY
jgi:hypothetical protein